LRLAADKFIQTQQITDVCKPHKVVTVSANDTVQHVYSTLQDNNISFVPVLIANSQEVMGT
jgi:predicted transcriptional regulator